MKEIKVKQQFESGYVTIYTLEGDVTTVYVSSPYRERDTGAYNVLSDIINDLEILRDHLGGKNDTKAI